MYIAGTGLVKGDGTPRKNLYELIFEATSEALRGAGLTRQDIDAVCIAASDQQDGRAISSMLLATPAGSYLKEEIKVSDESSLGLAVALAGIDTGVVERMLVVSWTKPSESEHLAAVGVNPEPVFTRPIGVHPVVAEGLVCQQFLHAHGLSVDSFETLAAHLRGDSTDGSIAVWPLKSSYIPPVSDGAVAAVVTAQPAGVKVESLAFGSDHHQPTPRVFGKDSLLARLARDVCEQAGLSLSGDLVIETTDRNVIRHCISLSELSLGLPDLLKNPGETLKNVNRSGGLWASNPPVGAGLERVVQASRLIESGTAREALAHSSYGVAGQGQFVCALRAA